jgi:glycosyltransferase involved in cell wall biosynthesis
MDSKTRITIVILRAKGGGIERLMIRLARWLSDRIDVQIVVLKEGKPFTPSIPNHIATINLAKSRILKSIYPLYKHLNCYKPDYVLATQIDIGFASLIASELSNYNIPVFANLTTNLHMSSLRDPSVRKYVLGLLIDFFGESFDQIVPVSKGAAKGLRSVVGRDLNNVTPIHNPAVGHDIYDGAAENASIPWFESNECNTLIAVGRLEAVKDYPTMVEAFKKVSEKRDVRLLILGEGSERDNINELISKYGLEEKIKMPGYVDNPYKYISRSDLLVHSSTYEGLPTVLPEALALGTPVVSTDCDYGPREILKSGEIGPLVPVGNPDRLAKSIISTLDNPPNQCVLKDRGKDFSVERIGHRYLSLFR